MYSLPFTVRRPFREGRVREGMGLIVIGQTNNSGDVGHLLGE
jgi:hypothetical protein